MLSRLVQRQSLLDTSCYPLAARPRSPHSVSLSSRSDAGSFTSFQHFPWQVSAWVTGVHVPCGRKRSVGLSHVEARPDAVLFDEFRVRVSLSKHIWQLHLFVGHGS